MHVVDMLQQLLLQQQQFQQQMTEQQERQLGAMEEVRSAVTGLVDRLERQLEKTATQLTRDTAQLESKLDDKLEAQASLLEAQPSKLDSRLRSLEAGAKGTANLNPSAGSFTPARDATLRPPPGPGAMVRPTKFDVKASWRN